MSKVYIIILNWNGWEDTIACLNTLKEATYPNFHVVVIDNASTNDSLINIRKWAQTSNIPLSEYTLKSRNSQLEQLIESNEAKYGMRRLELISSKENLGFCAGNNVGMEFASKQGADYFLILNNDTLCEPDFIEPMVDTIKKENNIGLVGGLICYADKPKTIWFGGGNFDKWLNAKNMYTGKPLEKFNINNEREVGLVTGCMILISVNIWKEVGGFDEQFFFWSEDWDLSIRMKKKGYKISFVKESKIYHKVSKSLGYFSQKAYYYGTRNSLLLRKKHLSKVSLIIYLIYFLSTRIPRYSYFAFKGRFDLIIAGYSGIRDFFLKKTGQAY